VKRIWVDMLDWITRNVAQKTQTAALE
jgi:hypothetical protein